MDMMSDEVVLFAGDKLRIRVPVSGSPAPAVTWTRDDQDLRDYVKVCFSSFVFLFQKHVWVKHISV